LEVGAAVDRTQPPHYFKARPAVSQKVGSNIPPKAVKEKRKNFKELFYKSKWGTRWNQLRLLFTDECPIKKAICQKTGSIFNIINF